MAFVGSPLGSLVDEHRAQIVAFALQHCARLIALFGSVARGEDTGESDVDVLVEFEPGSSLLDLIHLEESLHGLLGVSVDVVPARALLERDNEILRDLLLCEPLRCSSSSRHVDGSPTKLLGLCRRVEISTTAK